MNKGDIYGELTIIDEVEPYITNSGKKVRMLRCNCSCGKIKDIRMDLLRSGGTKSCGCLKGKNNIKHGMSKTKIYKQWEGMKKRCNMAGTQEKFKSYIGITYSKEWEKFENFYNDMGSTWFEGCELDKDILCNKLGINPKRYGSDTCIWITKQMNTDNRSSGTIVEYLGRKQSIKAWANELGLNDKLLYKRISEYGWTTKDAFTKKTRSKIKIISYKGETNSVKYFSDKYGIKYRTLSDRLSKGLSVEESIETKLQRGKKI